MTISDLPEGARFRTGGEPPYKTGTLLRLGFGSATVKFDGPVKTRSFFDKKNMKQVSFNRRKDRIDQVTLAMEVVPL